MISPHFEQNHDLRGILWPTALAPFQVAIAPIGWSKNAEVRVQAERLHDELSRAQIEVLLDDRDERPGVMFADLELIGKAYGCAVTRISTRAEVNRIPDLLRAPGPQFIVVDTSVQAIISRPSNVREAIE